MKTSFVPLLLALVALMFSPCALAQRRGSANNVRGDKNRRLSHSSMSMSSMSGSAMSAMSAMSGSMSAMRAMSGSMSAMSAMSGSMSAMSGSMMGMSWSRRHRR